MIEKRKFYKKYNKFVTVQSIGEYWIGQGKKWLPIRFFIETIALTSISAKGLATIDWWIFHHISISFSAIVFYVVLAYYGFQFFNWAGGWIAIMTGLQKAQADINTKDEHLNPYQVEMTKTIENICEKIGAKSEFTKL